MSWNLVVVAAGGDGGPAALVDLPHLGPQHEVLARVHALLPDLKVHDERWWTLARPRDAVFVEFLLPARDPVTSFGMRVDGTDAAFDLVVDLLERCGWAAEDVAAGAQVTAASRESFRLATGAG